MAAANVLNTTVSKVNTIKSTPLTSTETTSIVPNYAEISIATIVSDYGTIVGSSRQVQYTASTMTSLQKSNTGADKLPLSLWNRVKLDGSTYVHDGSTGKFIVVSGVLYHYPSTSDFEDCVDLITYRMPYDVLSGIGTTPEANTALSNYNTFKATLS